MGIETQYQYQYCISEQILWSTFSNAGVFFISKSCGEIMEELENFSSYFNTVIYSVLFSVILMILLLVWIVYDTKGHWIALCAVGIAISCVSSFGNSILGIAVNDAPDILSHQEVMGALDVIVENQEKLANLDIDNPVVLQKVKDLLDKESNSFWSKKQAEYKVIYGVFQAGFMTLGGALIAAGILQGANSAKKDSSRITESPDQQRVVVKIEELARKQEKGFRYQNYFNLIIISLLIIFISLVYINTV